jgi:3-isopropylmalate dehydrogenase
LPTQYAIAVIGGDGIGPEVTEAAIPAIDAAARHGGATLAWERLPYGAEHYLETGETLPDDAFRHLRDDVHAILLGALGDPRVPGNEHARDILLGLRFKLDLYINFRPCTLLHPGLCPLKPRANGTDGRAIDFVIFRENTEGSYLGRGSAHNVGTPEEEQIAEEVHTAPKVERIIRAAFAWAQAHGKRRVTMSDKSNAIPAHRLWGRLFEQIGEEYPNIEQEHRYVDALAMELVRDPERFDVIVTSNLFGDILSDLGAELVGGLGVAASGNLHPGRAGLFEPVHGSAPPLVGTGQANPLATVLTGALMLADLGLEDAADRIQAAVQAALAQGITTPDLGGRASVSEVGRFIEEHVAGAG